jgi:FdhD protein
MSEADPPEAAARHDPRLRSVRVSRHRAERRARGRGPFPGEIATDTVVVEEPLEIRVEGVPAAITMRTPGDDLDLAAGFLFTEGVIDGADDIRALASISANVVDVRLAEGVPAARARSADRQLYATSSCGICGKAAIDRIRRPGRGVAGWVPGGEVTSSLERSISGRQSAFLHTGAAHAAALFDRTGEVWCVREDVGRHNAVDKVIGACVRRDAHPAGQGLWVSSRAGFEIVQKAAVAEFGCVVSVGAPTSLAIDTALGVGLCLVSWAREGRWTVYARP